VKAPTIVDAKRQFAEATKTNPQTKTQWGKVIKAADTILRSAGAK
jgi:hypothetical protein